MVARGKMEEDYYRVLGINRTASVAEIQKAYREMARKHHPDMNPDDKKAKERFQAVQRAYEVLSDPQKRELYDRYGSSFESVGQGPRGAYRSRRGPGGPGGFSAEEIDLSEIFGGRPGDEGGPGGFAEIFRQFTGGGRRANRTAARGANLEHELTIPFNTAITGGDLNIHVQRDGSHNETLSVKIPPGIEDGKKIRLRGQGSPGPQGGDRGDLLITVNVTPHPFFQRRGPNLEVKLPITLHEAIAGATVEVPTPEGVISLKIPPGTSSGKRLRIRGHGVPNAKGTRGDLFVEVQIQLPGAPDDLNKLAELTKGFHDSAHSARASIRW